MRLRPRRASHARQISSMRAAPFRRRSGFCLLLLLPVRWGLADAVERTRAARREIAGGRTDAMLRRTPSGLSPIVRSNAEASPFDAFQINLDGGKANTQLPELVGAIGAVRRRSRPRRPRPLHVMDVPLTRGMRASACVPRARISKVFLTMRFVKKSSRRAHALASARLRRCVKHQTKGKPYNERFGAQCIQSLAPMYRATRGGRFRAICRRGRCRESVMKRIGAFFIASWSAAAMLYLGRHSVPMIAMSGIVVFAGFDLLRP